MKNLNRTQGFPSGITIQISLLKKVTLNGWPSPYYRGVDMKTLTIKFIPRPDGYEDVEVEAEGIEKEHVLDGIAHALMMLRLHGDKPEKLKRVK